ncbi:hypothetical protein Tco_0717279 [Tanacetum coccineum]
MHARQLACCHCYCRKVVVAKAGGFVPSGCCLYYLQSTLFGANKSDPPTHHLVLSSSNDERTILYHAFLKGREIRLCVSRLNLLVANHATRVLCYGIYGVCNGILAYRGLSLVSSPLHTMKSQSQIQSSATCSCTNITSTGPSQKRSGSPSSPFFPDAITFSDGKPASETSELNPEDVTARLEDLEVEIDTLHADTEDKELLISELQDSLAAVENEIAMLQIRVADAEDRRAEDHDQIQKILARLGL